MHTPRAGNLFEGQPVVIEAVDIPERVAIALAALDTMMIEGLVTVQDISAIRYIKDPKFGHSGGK
jgi:PII-like signaling protein